MDPETFARLSQNIGKQARLEQLPFAAAVRSPEGIRLELVSGHHRVRAARVAGVLEVYVLVDVTGLSHSQIVAKQLAHNSIFGKDDEDVLAELFAEMAELEDMLESHIDPRALSTALPLDTTSFTPLSVDHRTETVVLTFLPTTTADFRATCELIALLDPDAIDALPEQLADRFIEACRQVGLRCQIRQTGAIVARMLEIIDDWLAKHVETEDPKDEPAVVERKKQVKQKLRDRRPAAAALDAFARATAKAADEQAKAV